MKAKKIFKILSVFVTLVIVFGIFGTIIEHWINMQTEEPLILFTGEVGTAFSKYFTLIQNVTSYPFYFLCCVLYGFLAKKYYLLTNINTFKFAYALLSFVAGFLIGIISLFFSNFLSALLTSCIFGFFNIDSTLHIIWLIHPLIIISVSVFIGVLIFTVLIEKTIIKK